MEITLPLDQMTVAEKLRLMDVLWADLERRPEDVPSPAWHEQVLKQREADVAAGRASFRDWEDVKQSLFERYS